MADEKRARELSIAESRMLAERYPYDGTVEHCHDGASDGSFSFLCTRERGHAGPHVAWAPKGPIAIWDEGSDPT